MAEKVLAKKESIETELLTEKDLEEKTWQELLDLFDLWSGNVAHDMVLGYSDEIEVSQANKALSKRALSLLLSRKCV